MDLSLAITWGFLAITATIKAAKVLPVPGVVFGQYFVSHCLSVVSHTIHFYYSQPNDDNVQFSAGVTDKTSLVPPQHRACSQFSLCPLCSKAGVLPCSEICRVILSALCSSEVSLHTSKMNFISGSFIPFTGKFNISSPSFTSVFYTLRSLCFTSEEDRRQHSFLQGLDHEQ